MIAASAALTLSGVPFMGPIGAARVGFVDGAYVLNPAVDDMEKLRDNPEQRLDLIVAGTKDAVMMVESEAYELTEAEMLGAVKFGHEQMQPVIDLIIDMAEDAAKEPFAFDAARLRARSTSRPRRSAARRCAPPSASATSSSARTRSPPPRRRSSPASTEEEQADPSLDAVIKKLESDVVRWDILDHGRRIDGRDLVTVRPIVAEVGVLPRTHGSSLFTRGETQALVVTTLGTGDDEQMIDALHGTSRSNFLLHYNFPPYSVGETGRMGSPGPPRDRPRQARLAGAAGGAAGRDRLPLHHPPRLGDHRVRTAPRRWRRSAARRSR